jgi:hypothetical protein
MIGFVGYIWNVLLNIVTFIRVSTRYIPKIEKIDDTKAGVDVSVSSFFLH